MYKRYETIFLASFAVLAVGLGFWGYAVAGSTFSAGGPWQPVRPFTLLEAARCLICAIGLLRLYDLFQPPHDPWQLIVAQVAVPGIAAVSAAQLFLVGVRKNIRGAMARRRTGHTIVCGIGEAGMQIVQNLRAAGHGVVAIDLRDDSPGAATCEKSGVPVLQGDARNPQVLLAAGIRRARNAVVNTGSDSENIDIALQIKSLCERNSRFKPGSIRVLAELRNDWMHRRLMASEKSALASAQVDVRLFNPFVSAARMLIRRLRLPGAAEFEADTFVLFGFGAYGCEIALHLVRSSPVALDRTLKILVFDRDAEAAQEKFFIGEPAVAAVAQIEFVTARVEPASPDLKDIVEPRLRSAGPLLGMALALGDDEASLCAALELRSLLDRDGRLHVPVYVRLEHYRRLGELVRDIENIACFQDRLQIFGTLEETLSPDVLLGSSLDTFAQALHDDYRLRAQASINPLANVPFHELPEFLKMSNRWRADHTPILMQLAGIHLRRDVPSPEVAELTEEQIELLAQLEHRRYSTERRLLDNRFGFAQHPHMVPWHELSEEHKNWNRREIARLPAIMAEVGIELRPARTVRLYDDWLAGACEELDRLFTAPFRAHCDLIVDLDNAQAVQAAARALSLPSLSVWLFSRQQPREFGLYKPLSASGDRQALLQRANGWAPRERLMPAQ